jgi:hypothetical protein
VTKIQQLKSVPGVLSRAFARWFRDLPARGLATQELTCLLAVVDPNDPALSNALARQDARLDEEYEEASGSGAVSIQSYAVPGLQSFRFTLIAPTAQSVGDEPPKAPSVLLMSLVFDGDQRDVLTALYEQMRPELEEILQHAQGFPGTSTVEQFIRFVLERRVRSGFFFRDIGLLDEEKQPFDLTRSEMEQAVSLRADFVRFYAQHRADSPEDLRAAFEAWRRERGVGLALPLSQYEKRIPDEHRWIRRVVDLTLRLQDRDARQDPDHRKRRVAHSKHHGFMQATFEVASGLPPRYARGLFANPGRYAAVVRTSNTTDTRRPDSKRDGRGVSIKVLDAGRLEDAVIQPQPEKRPAPCNDGLGVAESSADAISQDFLLIANPTFFLDDVRDFTVFRSLIDVEVPYRWLGALAFALENPRKTLIFARAFFQLHDHPFDCAYHSMTPYALGEDTVVRYIVEPRDPDHFTRFRAPAGTDNALSVSLRESLAYEPIVLDLYVHAPPPAEVDVEATTRDWDRKKYPPVRVATITIPPQDPTTPARLEQGERTVFNPWNARREHRPLGSLNRARLAIYRASAEARRVAVQVQPPQNASEGLPPPPPRPPSPPHPLSEPPPSDENASEIPPPLPDLPAIN